MPEVSVVTALYNCVDLTRQYVSSLIETMEDVDWELIIVDDGSTDGTHEYLRTLADNERIKILLNEQNSGYSRSNNRGASEACAPILAFLNNDLVLCQGWFQSMRSVLEAAENPGIVGNIQINPNTGLIDHAGVFFGLDGMPRQARKNRRKRPKAPYTEWNAVTAACMIIPSELFRNAGGFDETYRNGFEDIDLCLKLKKQGYRHYVSNENPIQHCVSASPGRHKNNDHNNSVYKQRWSDFAKPLGEKEWPMEYLKRYRRHWWKFNLGKFCSAIVRLLVDLPRKKLVYRP
jgi:GT2 family glycosyltransferase